MHATASPLLENTTVFRLASRTTSVDRNIRTPRPELLIFSWKYSLSNVSIRKESKKDSPRKGERRRRCLARETAASVKRRHVVRNNISKVAWSDRSQGLGSCVKFIERANVIFAWYTEVRAVSSFVANVRNTRECGCWSISRRWLSPSVARVVFVYDVVSSRCQRGDITRARGSLLLRVSKSRTRQRPRKRTRVDDDSCQNRWQRALGAARSSLR